MFTHLSLKNFKSWKQVPRMRLAPITGLFGTNSSGKTSILQLLLMLKQTVQSPDRMQVLDFGGDDRDLVDLGSFRDVVHGHSPLSVLSWRLGWRLPAEMFVENMLKKSAAAVRGRDMEFACAVKGSEQSSQVMVEELSYKLAETEFSMSETDQREYTLKVTPQAGYSFKRNQGRPWPLPPPVKCYGFPDQVRAYYQNAGFLSDFELAFEQLFSGLAYLGPLRDFPRRQYVWGGGAANRYGAERREGRGRNPVLT